MTLAAWLHTLSPIVWGITDTIAIRWYGLAYLAGFAIGYFILLALAKRRLIAIPAERIGDAIMWLVLGVLIGGRLGYVTFYDQSALTTFTKSFPFWGVFAIHKGGMAFHGGLIGVILAAWRISRGWKDPQTGQVVGRCSPLHMMDIGGLISPFGLCFGRIANFINGELLGRVVSPPGTPGPWWSVQYPHELHAINTVFPDGRVDADAGAVSLTQEQGRELYGLLSQVGAPTDSIARKIDLLVQHARDFAPQLKPLISSRHPSQLYQAVFEGLILGGALWLLWWKPRKPGFIGGWFLIIYGVLRIVAEFYRLPDAQFANGRPGGLSRGQWLSAAMVLAGVGLLTAVHRMKSAPVGGWKKSVPAAG